MPDTRYRRSLLLAGVLLGVVSLLPGRLVLAQQPAENIGVYLHQMQELSRQALEASQAAERAETVSEVKARADEVFEAIWGLPSGLAAEEAQGAAAVHGWKTRWQTTFSAFDSLFAARYGSEPPAIDDPQALGLIGRGLYVRQQFETAPDSAGPGTPGRRYTHEEIVAPLSNAIGWMRMDNGVTKGELQPRVDLTYKWDAPTAFWRSTADTGWLHEVYAQALNILKTDYEGDVDAARQHAAGMTELLEKAISGVDANGNGTVEPVMMEGGLQAAVEQAQAAGYMD